MKTGTTKIFGILFFLAATACGQAGGVQRFAIFAPVMGTREDVPSILLPSAVTEDNENVIIRDGEIHRAKLRSGVLLTAGSKTAVTDGFPVLKYYYYEKADGTDWLLAFTQAHVYAWDTVGLKWDLVFTCASNAAEWSVCTFNQVLYATNNVDKVQKWEGTSTFAAAGTESGLEVGTGVYLTKAKFITAFESHLLVGNVTVSGNACPTTIYWSDTNAGEDWNTDNAGYATLPGPDPLQCAGKIDDFLLIFSGRSIDQLWATGSSAVYNSRRLRTRLGCYSPDSLINGVNGELYFIDGQRNIRMIQSAMSDFDVISVGIDKTLKQLPQDQIHQVRGVYISEYEQKWWAIPYGPKAATNSQVICLSKYGAWTRLNVPVSAFGEWEEKTAQYTWANIDTLYASWDAAGMPWNTVEAQSDARMDIAGDYSGYTYNSHNADLDDGAAFTGYAVLSTDFSGAKGSPDLDVYKRLTGMTLYFRNEGSGTATVSVKRDLESDWQTAGTVSLSGTQDILRQQLNCDYRARHYLLKISAANPFRFVGVVFYYVPQGLR